MSHSLNVRQSMKCMGILGGFLALATLAWCKPVEDERVNLKYQTPEGKTIEIVGVGTATPESIEFWNTQGQRDPAITELFKTTFKNWQSSDFRFVLGAKFRIVLIKQTVSENVNFTFDDGRSRYPLMTEKQGDYCYGIVNLVPSVIDNSKFKVYASWVGKTETFDMPNKLRAKVVIHDKVFECANTGEPILEPYANNGSIPIYASMFDPWGMRWLFYVSGSPAQSQGFSIQPYPLDGNKKPIRLIDPSGKPVADTPENEEIAKTTLEGWRTEPGKRSFTVGYVQCFPNYGNNPQILGYQTNLDPKYAKWIRFYCYFYKSVTIEGLPSDPK